MECLYTILIVLLLLMQHTCLVSIPFSHVTLILPLLLWVLRLVFSLCSCFRGVEGHYGKLSAFGVLHWEAYSVHDDFLFLSFFSPLYIHTQFVNMHSHFSLFSSVCHSVLHRQLLYLMLFMYVRYYFFVIFVTPKAVLRISRPPFFFFF